LRKRILLLLTLTIVIPAISGCASPAPNAQNLSDQIAGIDFVETTALTSLLRISEELDKARNDGSLSEEEEAELRTDLMEKFNKWVNVREDQLNLSSLNLLPTQEQIAWTERESALLEGADEHVRPEDRCRWQHQVAAGCKGGLLY